jgi:hypothetical protein
MKSLFAAVAALAIAFSSMQAQAQSLPTQYPIKADDGDTVANFDLPAGKLAKLDALAGRCRSATSMATSR